MKAAASPTMEPTAAGTHAHSAAEPPSSMEAAASMPTAAALRKRGDDRANKQNSNG
jgi:hypothetical protein